MGEPFVGGVLNRLIADSTTEVEYVVASEAAKEAVWLKKFLLDLHVIPSADRPITLSVITVGP